jgi:hypothetical protein
MLARFSTEPSPPINGSWPTKFELSKAAKALDLKVSENLPAVAEEVIE